MSLSSRSWLIILIAVLATGIGVYNIRGLVENSQEQQSLKNQDYIIKTLNESAAHREQLFQDAKIAILNNLSHKIDRNYEAFVKVLHTMNISETNITRSNITFLVDNDTAGKVSGLGNPIVIH